MTVSPAPATPRSAREEAPPADAPAGGGGPRVAVIIGAGPAGLTAAYELLRRTDIKPVVLETSEDMGGLSRTVNYKGNRIDIGGHRFFSKSDRVMDWWLSILPVQAAGGGERRVTYQQQTRPVPASPAGPDPDADDRVMLLRSRQSRIYHARKFFSYPITLSKQTVRNLGLVRTALIGLSYLKASALPIRPEKTLEDFLTNRFGRALYRTFFKSYTEKVWGVPCDRISAEWGAQRIKGLNVRKVLTHALKRVLRPGRGVRQKGTETSLIEEFLYPKFGPGQMWEEVAARVRGAGGEIVTGASVRRVHRDGDRATGVDVVMTRTGERRTVRGDFVFSTMPVKELVAAVAPPVPAEVREVSDGLMYRDFLVVGLLVRRLAVGEATDRGGRCVRDNWIYVQEPDVAVGRLQVFNNWSPYLVADADSVWLGLEYFCNEDDKLWRMSDEELKELGAAELEKIGILDRADVRDGTVLRVPKAYPAYFGSYDRFPVVRDYLDRIGNLFLVGRNGMHKYNNQDHSMLAAMVAVDNIVAGRTDKENVWAVNTEQSYHETADRRGDATPAAPAD